MRQRARRLRRGVVRYLALASLALIIVACGEPTPPRLVHLSPVILMVPAGEEIAVRVVYEANDFEQIDFTWSAEAGEVVGSGAGITYRAPAEPGAYQIEVTASYGEGEERGELTRQAVVEVIPSTGLALAALGEQPDQGAAGPTEGDATAGGEPSGDAGAAPDDTDAAPEATADGSRLDRILADQQLRAAVQIAFPPFSFEDDGGQRVGFDVDLVRELARRWLDDPGALTLMPVTTAERLEVLADGRADVVAAALTKTPARAEQVELSLTYFADGQRLLVAEGATIAGVCDLAGQKVAAIAGSTSLDNLQAAAADCGFELGDDLVVFDRHEEAVQSLVDGNVAAFTSDGVALEALAEGRPLEVVGNHFSEEPYGIAVPKGDRRLRELVDATLVAMDTDGTYAAIYAKWFGDTISPYPLDAPEIEGDAAELDALTASTAAPLVAPVTVTPAKVGEHVVAPGDTLSKIAGKVYGDVSPASWRRIYEANRDAIGEDPSRIEVGMTLIIPQ